MRSIWTGFVFVLLAASFGSAVQVESTANVSPDALYAKYKCKYAYVDGDYLRLPDFELQFENSRAGASMPSSYRYGHKTETHYETVDENAGQPTSISTYTDGSGTHTVEHKPPQRLVQQPVTQDVRVRPSKEEVDERYRSWSQDLPHMKVGSFGFWPCDDRLTVTNILGPDDVLVSCNGTSFRLLGMDTSLMEEGQPITQLKTYKYIDRTSAHVTTYNTTKSTAKGEDGSTTITAQGEVRSFRENKTKGVAKDITIETGLHVSIAFVAYRPIPSFGTKPVLFAIPTSVVRTGLSREQFSDLLSRGIDPVKDDIAHGPSTGATVIGPK